MLENLLPPKAYQALMREKAEKLKQIAKTSDRWRDNIVTRTPHGKQQLFINSTAKRRVIRAGRRGGKTTGIAILALEAFKAGRRVLYAAPTEDQVNRFWQEVCAGLRKPVDDGILRKNETMHIIELKGTENRIRAKTAWNADTLRGDYADLLILDEFQLMNEDTWGVVGAPMMLDNNGDAVFIYTPPSLHSKSVTKARDIRHASKMYKKAEADTTGRWAAFHFTSHDNPHISEEALEEITGDMTTLAYEQEIMADDKDEVPGAFWKRDTIRDGRITREQLPDLVRIVIGVDPPGGATECGIVCAGLSADGHKYVLDDASLKASPDAWSSAIIDTYELWEVDRVIGEKNFGGDMVEHTIRTAEGGKDISYKNVTASRGKAVRAEPVAAQYERGKVHHVGEFPLLEEEMCTWIPNAGMSSPNRLDALVWAITELTDAAPRIARVRSENPIFG